MTGILDESGLGAAPTSGSMSGAYVPDGNGDGRGTISSNNSGSELGGFTLQYYVVDASTVVFVDVDSEAVNGVGSQLGVGTFEGRILLREEWPRRRWRSRTSRLCIQRSGRMERFSGSRLAGQ